MAPNEWLSEITVFEKVGGPLTKHLALRDRKIVNDSSACRTANGFWTHPPAGIRTPNRR
jgi:hypothetical protein